MMESNMEYQRCNERVLLGNQFIYANEGKSMVIAQVVDLTTKQG